MARDEGLAAAIARDLKLTLEGVVVDVTTGVTNALTAATPVDTSWASANWQPSVGQPAEPDGDNERAAELRELRLDLAPGAASAQEQALEQIRSSYTLEQGDTFVTNSVPYMERLDAGASPQASPGFVEATIEGAVAEAVSNFKIIEGA